MAASPSGDDMNRERAKQLLPIIQAFADGKDIEWRMDDEEWYTKGDPFWGDYFEYRIKPEPRVFWINPDANDSDAIIYEAFNPEHSDFIKVREVIE